MDTKEMDRLIEAHITAEKAGDTAGSVAMYTDDVEHDVVGTPHGPLRGKEAAQGFYDQLVRDIRTEDMVPIRSYYGEDFCVIEHEWTGTVPGCSSVSPATAAESPSDCSTSLNFETASSAGRTRGSTGEVLPISSRPLSETGTGPPSPRSL